MPISVLLVRNNQAPSNRALAVRVLVVVLRRERVALRDCYFVSASFAPIYTGPSGRRGGLQDFIESLIAAYIDELAVFVKRHRAAAPLLGEDLTGCATMAEGGGIGPRSCKGTLAYKASPSSPASHPPIRASMARFASRPRNPRIEPSCLLHSRNLNCLLSISQLE